MAVSDENFNPFVCEHCGSGNCPQLAGADCQVLLNLQEEYYKEQQKLEKLFHKWGDYTNHQYGDKSAVFTFRSEQERGLFVSELSQFWPSKDWYTFPAYNVEVFLW